MNSLLALINKFRQHPFLQIFTIYLRYLVGGGFVIAAIGMGKLSGQEIQISNPGAPIETLEPLQQFFRVMATSGLYWNFIGWIQIISGGLLMTQRFARLGAVMFFGMMLNIFVITISYGFQGTPVVTGLMLLAAAFFIVWDLDSFQFIFRQPGAGNVIYPLPFLQRHRLWTWTGALMFVTLMAMGVLRTSIVVQFFSSIGIGFAAFLIYLGRRGNFRPA